MATETVKSLFELVNENPDVDNSGMFTQLWEILGELRAKVDARFELRPDDSTPACSPTPR